MNTYKKFLEEKRNALKDYITKYNLKSLILGVSGGVDSAVMAAICKPVCNELHIPLIGVWIEIESNKADEKERALKVGEHLCDIFVNEDLTEQYICEKKKMDTPLLKVKNTKFISSVFKENDYDKKVRLGNIKARMRMIYLYNFAQRYKGVTLNTDNRTEWELGFYTLHGDHFDLNLLNTLWKTEIYELTRYIADTELCDDIPAWEAFLDCVRAVPTDGLGITNSDLEQFGCDSYTEVDGILKPLVEIEEEVGTELTSEALTYNSLCVTYGATKVEKIWNRHIKSSFKRNWPIKL